MIREVKRQQDVVCQKCGKTQYVQTALYSHPAINDNVFVVSECSMCKQKTTNKMPQSNTIELKFVSDFFENGFQWFEFDTTNTIEWFELTDNIQVCVEKLWRESCEPDPLDKYKLRQKMATKYKATIYAEIGGKVNMDFPITSVTTDYTEPNPIKDNALDDEGYYTGPEVQWNVEDVEVIAQRRFQAKLSAKDLERVLVAAFEDNEHLMEVIHDQIAETINYMIEEGQIKTQ